MTTQNIIWQHSDAATAPVCSAEQKPCTWFYAQSSKSARIRQKCGSLSSQGTEVIGPEPTFSSPFTPGMSHHHLHHGIPLLPHQHIVIRQRFSNSEYALDMSFRERNASFRKGFFVFSNFTVYRLVSLSLATGASQDCFTVKFLDLLNPKIGKMKAILNS